MRGWVYLIGPTDWRYGRVKIGRTIHSPRIRLQALQTGSPVPLDLYGYFPGDATLERVLHETFAPLRLHGEWFRLDHKLLDLVSNVVGETFGQMDMPDGRLWGVLQDCVLTDVPGEHVSAGEEEDWIDSANMSVLSSWMAEVALSSLATLQ